MLGTSLQRGKACLRCRKRKMRCDGAKPACQQCIRAKQPHVCEYDNGQGKTRTQIMRERIHELESKLRDLEIGRRLSPSMPIIASHNRSPYMTSSASSSSSGFDPTDVYAISAHSSPAAFPLDLETPAWSTQHNGRMHYHSSKTQPPYPQHPLDGPPRELAEMLLDIFLPHRHQCYFDVHVGRLRSLLHVPLEEQRHPVLMNAIYLWACYLSRPGSLCEHEPLYLSRALTALNEAIPNSSKTVDLVQATCLVSMYYLSTGRLLEGNYHATSAAALAMQWGLHRIGASETTPNVFAPEWGTVFQLEPPKDSIEQGERILTFWQVYNIDKCWSAALQRPATLPDAKHPLTTITTPWPQNMEEYESGEIDLGRQGPCLNMFFKYQAQASSLVGGFSSGALRVKASAAFDAVNKLTSSWDPRAGVTRTHTFTENFRALENTITRYSLTLPPLNQLAGALPDDRFKLYMCHVLAHTAMIRLHQPFILEDPVSSEKSLRAARAVTLITKQVPEVDFPFLDPFIGQCWVSAARVLIFELAQMESAWPPVHTADLRSELSTLFYALDKLGVKFPLLTQHALVPQTPVNPL